MSQVLSKYPARSVPRYTSYPTVPHFSRDFAANDYRGWLERLNPDETVSLYLHVPFCRKVCWYCGCNMRLASRYEPVAAYAETLRGEIELLAAALPARMTISHLHWGGGTPTALEPDDLERTMASVHDHFDFSETAELAIESDPRTLSREMTATIGRLGFNRASFGVQEFDPKVQQAINRVQPPEMVRAAVDGFRAVGVNAINFDLIYGLPYQTTETLMNTIDVAVAMTPDRVALFGYAHVPWMAKKQRLIPSHALPGTEARVAQADAAAEAFRRAGYVGIGFDHFALPHDDLAQAAQRGTLHRNFQGYTVDEATSLLGIGATSIGRTPFGYVQNIADTTAWSRAVNAGQLPVAKGHAFQGQDRIRGEIIEQLMCQGTVDLAEVAREASLPSDAFGAELEDLQEFARDGIVELGGARVRVTEPGQRLVRTVAAVFDSYYKQAPARHSLAV